MPESLQEQRPLLCDEYSDEESRIQDSGAKFHRRFRHSVCSGRARTHAVGAASIISSWPDNVSSLLVYWWIALGMFAFMVFLIYNSILAIAVLPETHSTLRHRSNDVTENKPIKNTSKPNIYMHVFVANYEEFNSNDYVPYVQIITKKYTNFKYNFIVVLNDTVNDKSDEQKNEMALNFLWSDNKIIMSKKKLHEDFTVTYVSLKEYMDNSPLKKYWRLVPYQFIGFLARCVAIWDKGGVAFDPFILTPNSPNSVYLEKLHGVLGNYQSNSKSMVPPKRNITKKAKKKVNNIRDIITGLENGENMSENIISDNLEEAENIQTTIITSSKNKRNVNPISFDRHYSPQLKEEIMDEILHKNNFNNESKRKSSNFIKPIKEINTTQATGDKAAAQNILSNFLKYLFHLNSKNLTSVTRNMNNFTEDFTLSENINLDHFLNNDTTSEIGPVVKELNIKANTKNTNKTPGGNENTKLTLDLKGNIIATEIGCHAFIGTVFSNVCRHTYDETITDFIINELSLFCKGSLSTCNNVEVLLLEVLLNIY